MRLCGEAPCPRLRHGPGFSSMAVSGGRVFTLEKRAVNGSDREFCVALSANTGDLLWAIDLDTAEYSNLIYYDDRMDGSRSTPTVDGDRVYVFNSQLKRFCLDVQDGNIVWRRDFRAELGSSLISWQNAGSPLLVGDLIFVNTNARAQALMAIRKSDGVTQEDGMPHANPIFARIRDVPQVIFLTRCGLVAVVPESGTVLWRLPFAPSATSTAASPAVEGDYVYASAAYASGTWIGRVMKDGESLTASQAWRQQGTAYEVHWPTPAADRGFFYCVASPSSPQAKLVCLDVAAGSNRWTEAAVGSGGLGYGSIIKAGNILVILTEAGGWLDGSVAWRDTKQMRTYRASQLWKAMVRSATGKALERPTFHLNGSLQTRSANPLAAQLACLISRIKCAVKERIGIHPRDQTLELSRR